MKGEKKRKLENTRILQQKFYTKQRVWLSNNENNLMNMHMAALVCDN